MEKRLSPEVLKERYKAAVRFTTGAVFGPGDARLGPEVRDEVIRRRRAREEKAKAVVDNAKKKLRELAWEVEKNQGGDGGAVVQDGSEAPREVGALEDPEGR